MENDDEEMPGMMSQFTNTIHKVNMTIVGLLGGITGIVLFISVYPVMPFLMILSFMVAILKYFFYVSTSDARRCKYIATFCLFHTSKKNHLHLQNSI